MKEKRDNKIMYLGVIVALLLITISILLLRKEYKIYSLITLSLTAIDCILLFFYMNNTKTNHDKYQSDIKYILKTFDSVLAKLDCDLHLEEKEIIKLESFAGIVNAQEEIKKPILYTLDSTTAVFILIDNNSLYYTTIKEDEKLKNPLEVELVLASKKKKENTNCDAMLEGIDHTTIVQTKNNKKYKISPLKKENDKKVNEVSNTQALDYIKNNYFPKTKNSDNKISDEQALSFMKDKVNEEQK